MFEEVGAVPIAAIFDASGASFNPSADYRQQLSDAEVILGVDVMSQKETIVFGLQLLEEIAANGTRPIRVLRVALDFETDEMEHLLALVFVMKGHHDYHHQGAWDKRKPPPVAAAGKGRKRPNKKRERVAHNRQDGDCPRMFLRVMVEVTPIAKAALTQGETDQIIRDICERAEGNEDWRQGATMSTGVTVNGRRFKAAVDWRADAYYVLIGLEQEVVWTPNPSPA